MHGMPPRRGERREPAPCRDTESQSQLRRRRKPRRIIPLSSALGALSPLPIPSPFLSYPQRPDLDASSRRALPASLVTRATSSTTGLFRSRLETRDNAFISPGDRVHSPERLRRELTSCSLRSYGAPARIRIPCRWNGGSGGSPLSTRKPSCGLAKGEFITKS